MTVRVTPEELTQHGASPYPFCYGYLKGAVLGFLSGDYTRDQLSEYLSAIETALVGHHTLLKSRRDETRR